MSRDFSPKEQWIAHMEFPDLHFSNIVFCCGDRQEPMYSEEELEDRRRHPHIHVLGSDIFRALKELLTEAEFEDLDKTLGDLVGVWINGESLDGFPPEMVAWFENRNDHYYHEPNDEEFMEYMRRRKTKNGS